jgi:ATP-dependent DNA helicase DinG
MVRDEEKQLIRQCVEALREGIPGFRSRRPQMEMIAAVANTLSRCRAEDEQAGNGDHLAIVEAGTGTGKSFGALVPALVMAKSRNKRLVVSSSTVALQHQYAEKDAPSLQRLLPIPFTFAVAKGRRRYACTVKLQAEGKLAGQAGLDLVGEGAPEGTVDAPRRVAAMRELLVTFDTGRWSGDRDELPLPVVDEVWERITTDRQGCAGSKCPEFARCPFQAARQRVKEADVVIANHDLVLSAIDMDGASVLPSPHETIYVFDEAHSLAAKAVEHFSARHALRGAMEWLEGACNAVRDAVLGLRLDEQLIRDSRASAERMERALRDLHSRIHGTNGFEEKRARRFRSGPLPDWCKSAGGQVLAAGEELQKTFASLREHVLEKAPSVGALATQVLSVLGFYVVRLDNLVDTWQLMLTEQPEGSPPIARWIEQHDEGGRSDDYQVCASPISGSDKLRKLLWNRASGAVVMSATLTSCGTFDLFLRQSGLGYFDSPAFLRVESPFDFRNNARLVVPAMRTEPTSAEQHTLEVSARLPALVETLGTLVLFTSARQMREVYAQLPEDLRRITLVQGSMPKGEMLARHRAAVDRVDRSVLFGLSSFAEGVDLPGEYCTHVVIAKLPFSVPDSPLEEARREWVESRGGSPFIEITVPEAAVRLKQGLGRLLRTIHDRGRVTILDRRIVTKRWGGLLMRGMPDFEVVIERGRAPRAVAPSAAGLKKPRPAGA